MANIGFKLIGRGKWLARTMRISRELSPLPGNKLYKAINRAGQLIRSEAVKGISKGMRSGNIYKRGKAGKVHKASAQGELPKTDTGNLVNNITVEQVGKFAVEVGSRIQAPEGYWLETKEPSQGGRPWLKPTFEKNVEKMEKIIAATVREVVEKEE